MSRCIYLLRHGEVDGSAALYGRTDVPLSEQGWQQLLAQTQRLPNIDLVVSSPLQRCRVFADYLRAQWQCPLVLAPDLQECDFGRWDGVPFSQIPESEWGQLDAFWQQPAKVTLTQAESLAAMQQRVLQAWRQHVLSKQYAHTLILCHGGVIRLLLAHLLDLDWRNPALFSRCQIGYASLSKISLANHPDAVPKVDFIGLPWHLTV